MQLSFRKQKQIAGNYLSSILGLVTVYAGSGVTDRISGSNKRTFPLSSLTMARKGRFSFRGPGKITHYQE